jgi:spore maturation protein CgeB
VLSVAISHQKYLVQRELVDAFRAVPGVRVVVVDMPMLLPAQSVPEFCAALEKNDCRIFVTLNDWGLDKEGAVRAFLEKRGIVHVNWYVDDPFFSEIMFGVSQSPSANRIDFVSDRGYVEPLTKRGFKARFLPLATDPAIFFPRGIERGNARGPAEKINDLCFVGNSYIEGTYKFIKGFEGYFEKLNPGIMNLCSRYSQDSAFDLDSEVEKIVSKEALPQGLGAQKAAYLVKHFIGYLHRKRLVLSLSKSYPGFMVYGDAGWGIDLAPERMSTKVKYYTNLSESYEHTKITADINRVVIRDGFTQRVFDCLAAGGFVLTSYKKVVGEFFETAGPAQELGVFVNEADLREKIDYFLGHDAERKAIASRGRSKVLAKHTYGHRVAEIFAEIRKALGAIQ